MPSSWWRVKGSLYLTLGVLLLLAFALGILIGVSYYVGWPYYAPGNLTLFAALCTPTALLPGLLLLFLGRKARKNEKDLVEFTAWIKTYRRIGLADLAAKLGKNQVDAEKLLIRSVDQGLLKGFIDRATNEFVLQEAVGQENFIDACPKCGANLRKRYFLGETVVCPYCQSVVVAPPPPRSGGLP